MKKYKFIKNPATGLMYMKIYNPERKNWTTQYELPAEWKDNTEDELKQKMKEYDWEFVQYGSVKIYTIKSKKIIQKEEQSEGNNQG